jgi:hypothetical protein
MSAMKIGEKMVALCREGKNLEALETLFSADAESIEAQGNEQMPAEMKGLEALKKKNEWFFANHEIHGGNVKGPFPNGERFTVIFDYDVTPKAGPMAGKRMQMEEVGLYTVESGKIVREEFFYSGG